MNARRLYVGHDTTDTACPLCARRPLPSSPDTPIVDLATLRQIIERSVPRRFLAAGLRALPPRRAQPFSPRCGPATCGGGAESDHAIPTKERHVTRTTVEQLPSSLSADDREWLLARAGHVGGLTEAFVHLVRINILTDAVFAANENMRTVVANLAARGWPRARIEKQVWRATARLTVTRLTRRLICASTWRRPAAGDRRRPHDDPAVPLPPDLTRRLIAEGRPHFVSENRRLRSDLRCH